MVGNLLGDTTDFRSWIFACGTASPPRADLAGYLFFRDIGNVVELIRLNASTRRKRSPSAPAHLVWQRGGLDQRIHSLVSLLLRDADRPLQVALSGCRLNARLTKAKVESTIPSSSL